MHHYHPYTRPTGEERPSRLFSDHYQHPLNRPLFEGCSSGANPFRLRHPTVFRFDDYDSDDGGDNSDGVRSPSPSSSSFLARHTLSPILPPIRERAEVFPDFLLNGDGRFPVTGKSSASSSGSHLESRPGCTGLGSWTSPGHQIGEGVFLPSIHSLHLPGCPFVASRWTPPSAYSHSPPNGFRQNPGQETVSLRHIGSDLLGLDSQALPQPPINDRRDSHEQETLPSKEASNALMKTYLERDPLDKGMAYCRWNLHSESPDLPEHLCTYSSRTDTVMRHIRVSHLKIKRWACEFCSARFGSKHALETHMTIHTGERPYRCNDCGADFNDSSKLHHHRKKLHGYVPEQRRPRQTGKPKGP